MLPQIDGNVSLSSLESENISLEKIPIQVGFRPLKESIQRPATARILINRNCKVAFAQTLPKVTLYNAHSLFRKISSLMTDMEERATDVCFITEVWESLSNKKHQSKIEELLEPKRHQIH